MSIENSASKVYRPQGATNARLIDRNPRLPHEIRSARRPVTLQPELSPAGVTETWFEWDPINMGDCTLRNARMIIRSDGTGRFTAVASSTDTHDIWKCEFDFFDARGNLLFHFPAGFPSGVDYAIVMTDANTDYPIDTSDYMTFDASSYARASICSMTYDC